MKCVPDQQLLTDYVRSHSEAAFAELVARHLGVVYSTARRIVVDRHLAEDIAQRVFVTLAREAGKLARRTVISGWLHRTTHNFAVMTIRAEERRRAREGKAAVVMAHPEDPSPWGAVSPQLDDALARLRETDRDAITLHFFERKSAREISDLWGISAEAAQKRVTRAVGRLRRDLGRHLPGLTPCILGGVLSTQTVEGAPASLAGSIAVHAVAEAGNLGTSAVAAWWPSFDWIIPLRPKPWFTGSMAVAVLSLGAGGFATGRLAAEKHRRASAWEDAVLASAPPVAPMARNVVGFDQAQDSTATTGPEVEAVVAEAARLLRAQNSDSYAWAQAFTAMEQLLPEQGRSALAELAKYREESGVFAGLAPLVMAVWAQSEPRAALDHALANYRENTLALSIEFITRAWAGQEPRAAWEWYRATTDAQQIPIAHGSWMWVPSFIFSEWVAREPTAAFAEFQRIPYAEQRNAMQGIAAAALDSERRPGILAGIAGLPDETDRTALAAKVASNWARLSPSAAANWAGGLSFNNPAARLQVMAEVAEEWWASDPHATAQWLLTNSPREMLDEVHVGIRAMSKHSKR